jgi:hypothetical protein
LTRHPSRVLDGGSCDFGFLLLETDPSLVVADVDDRCLPVLSLADGDDERAAAAGSAFSAPGEALSSSSSEEEPEEYGDMNEFVPCLLRFRFRPFLKSCI